MNNMNAKDCITEIKKILADEMCLKAVSEYLDTLEEIIYDYKDQIKDLKKEADDLQDEVDKANELSDFETHYIGLDVLHIKLDYENIESRARIDTFIERLKSYNGASIV